MTDPGSQARRWPRGRARGFWRADGPSVARSAADGERDASSWRPRCARRARTSPVSAGRDLEPREQPLLGLARADQLDRLAVPVAPGARRRSRPGSRSATLSPREREAAGEVAGVRRVVGEGQRLRARRRAPATSPAGPSAAAPPRERELQASAAVAEPVSVERRRLECRAAPRRGCRHLRDVQRRRADLDHGLVDRGIAWSSNAGRARRCHRPGTVRDLRFARRLDPAGRRRRA